MGILLRSREIPRLEWRPLDRVWHKSMKGPAGPQKHSGEEDDSSCESKGEGREKSMYGFQVSLDGFPRSTQLEMGTAAGG